MSRINKTFLLLFVTIILSLTILILLNGQPVTKSTGKQVPMPAFIKATPAPTPLPTPTITIKTTSQISPDGSMELMLKAKTENTGEQTYELSVKDVNKQAPTQIFKENWPQNISLSIPFNTWAPDHKYFFVTKQTGLPATPPAHYLVFQNSGAGFGEDKYLDVTELFLAKELPYELDEVTGWAAPGLLLVNTKKPDSGEQGPSYWFEIYSNHFIQLSTRF